MKINERTITKGIFSYIFCIILLEPAAFQHFAYVSTAFRFLHILVFFIVLFFWTHKLLVLQNGILKVGSNRSNICVALISYYGYLILNTYIHEGRTLATLYQGIQFVGFVIYLDLLLKNNPQELFRSVLKVLTTYVFLNAVIIIVMPEGLYSTSYYTNNYLLGYDNQNINFLLPTMIIVLLKNIYYQKCRLQLYITYAVCIFTALKIWSAMTIVVVMLMTVIALFCIRKNGFIINNIIKGKVFNFFNLLITNFAMVIGIVFLKLYEYFEFFIVGVLKKSMTLSNRIYIWEKAIYWIKKAPILGYGREQYGIHANKFGYAEHSSAGLHAHNRILEVTYSGGIVLLSIYVYILLRTAKCLGSYKDTIAAKIISMGLFVYLVGMITEFYDYCIFFWGLMVIAEHCGDIVGDYR